VIQHVDFQRNYYLFHLVFHMSHLFYLKFPIFHSLAAWDLDSKK